MTMSSWVQFSPIGVLRNLWVVEVTGAPATELQNECQGARTGGVNV